MQKVKKLFERNCLLDYLSRLSVPMRYFGLLPVLILIFPLYFFTQMPIPEWVQTCFFCLYVVAVLHYIFCLLLSFLHSPQQKADGFICNIQLICTACICIFIGVSVSIGSSGSSMESARPILTEESPSAEYRIVVYGSRKDFFSGFDADVFVERADRDDEHQLYVCSLENARTIGLYWEDDDIFYVNQNGFTLHDDAVSPLS